MKISIKYINCSNLEQMSFFLTQEDKTVVVHSQKLEQSDYK